LAELYGASTPEWTSRSPAQKEKARPANITFNVAMAISTIHTLIVIQNIYEIFLAIEVVDSHKWV